MAEGVLQAGPEPDRGDDGSIKPDTNMEGRPDAEAEPGWWIGNGFKSGTVYCSLICFMFDGVDITMCYFSHSSLTLDQKDLSYLFVKDLDLSVWFASQYPLKLVGKKEVFGGVFLVWVK